MKNYIFLTRTQIEIVSSSSMFVHLKKGDKRIDKIHKGLESGTLKIVTVNPYSKNFNKFYKDNWYLIETIQFVEHFSHSGYEHYVFQYKFEKNFYWEKEGIKVLDMSEISTFRKKLTFV